jgi:hypothetical protein
MSDNKSVIRFRNYSSVRKVFRAKKFDDIYFILIFEIIIKSMSGNFLAKKLSRRKWFYHVGRYDWFLFTP